jgi:hypothetical protein
LAQINFAYTVVYTFSKVKEALVLFNLGDIITDSAELVLVKLKAL